MTKDDALKMLEAFNAMLKFLPDNIVLDTVKNMLPETIENSKIPDEKVAELVTLYRKRDVPAIKQFFHRMFDDAKREVSAD